MQILLFLFSGILGWKLFEYIKIPAAPILGSMLAVACFNILGLQIDLPSWFKPFVSVATGIILGLRFNIAIKKVLRQAVLFILWLMLLSVVTAKVLSFAGLNESTAFLAATPGGIAEMSLIALSFGADSFVTALLHFSRMIVSMTFTPLMVLKNKEKISQRFIHESMKGNFRLCNWIIVTVGSTTAGLLLSYFNIPSGYMIGSMVFTAIYVNAFQKHTGISNILQKIVQVGIGGMIGLTVTKESLMSIPNYIFPILILNFFIFGGSFLFAQFLHRTEKWDLTTCLLAVSPGGLSPMIMMAIDLGANSDIVTIFQVLRLFTFILLAPLTIQLIL